MSEQASSRRELVELAPVLRRAITLDPASLARVRLTDGNASVLVRLPFGALIARTVAVASDGEPIDITARADELLAWLDDPAAAVPQRRDVEWRTGLPPAAGWERIDTVPDDIVRGLVRSGALALTESAAREGLPRRQPRAEVADALLDSVVLTVTQSGSSGGGGSGAATGRSAAITLRTLSALTRMGFLPRGSHIAVDVAGRWIRVAAEYGSVYTERPGLGLGVLTR